MQMPGEIAGDRPSATPVYEDFFFSESLSLGSFCYLFLRVHFGGQEAPVSFLELFIAPQLRCLLHHPFLSHSQDYSCKEGT